MKYNENVVHHLYRPMVRSGLGFGAQRWMATLQRQYMFLGSMRLFSDPKGDHACPILFHLFKLLITNKNFGF